MPKSAFTVPRGPVVVDIEGSSLTDAERARLQHPLVGGVIIFARNFESRSQIRKLCREIRRLRKPRLLICVDHEGCLLYTSPSPRDKRQSRMPSSA